MTDITERNMPKRSPGNTPKHGKRTRKARETRKKKVTAETQPVARDPSGRFLSSGNPNGRPTAALEVREMAREHGPEAIERLVYWMRSGDSQSSIAAAKILLDRGYGKSMQLLGSPNGAPLVNINMGNGAPITSAADAARVYAEILGRPDFDLSAIKFAVPEALPAPPQASEEPAAQPIASEPVSTVARVQPVSVNLSNWERLAE